MDTPSIDLIGRLNFIYQNIIYFSYRSSTYIHNTTFLRVTVAAFWGNNNTCTEETCSQHLSAALCFPTRLRRRRVNRLLHADLVIVLGAVAASVSIEPGVLLPYLCIAAVTGSDPPEELLQFGAEALSSVTAAVAQVLHNGSDQDLQNLQTP